MIIIKIYFFSALMKFNVISVFMVDCLMINNKDILTQMEVSSYYLHIHQFQLFYAYLIDIILRQNDSVKSRYHFPKNNTITSRKWIRTFFFIYDLQLQMFYLHVIFSICFNHSLILWVVFIWLLILLRSFFVMFIILNLLRIGFSTLSFCIVWMMCG